MSKSVIICRCEDVTEEEVIQAIEQGARSLEDVKKITRAGMGYCQGKTCRRQIARLLAGNRPVVRLNSFCQEVFVCPQDRSDWSCLRGRRKWKNEPSAAPTS